MTSLLPRLWWALLAMAYLCAGAFMTPALGDSPTEKKVKSAFLYHFVQFTEWPADMFSDKNARIRICVYGDDPFEGFLERTFDGKTIDGRQFLIQHNVSTSQIEDCHLLFVNREVNVQKKSVKKVVQQSRGLLVGETDDFLRYGGMIQFYRAGNKIRFAVNQDALERNNIHLSSKLLRLAKIVKSE